MMGTQSPRCRWCQATRVRIFGGRIIGLAELKNYTSAMLVCAECDLPMGPTH